MTGAPLLQVRGSRQLRATLRRAGDDLGELKAVHARIGSLVAAAAARAAPHRTGALAADVRSSGTNTAAIIRSGRARLPYAGPIHWGWPSRGIRAQPFMTDAAANTEGTWVGMYVAAVDTILANVQGATHG